MEHNLTEENYYSSEADYEYMSVSQYKNFAGSYGRRGCEFTALAKLRREYEEPTTTALLVGSYVDRYFEGTLDAFKAEHPEILKRDGTLKADYIRADKIIKRIERDDLFMSFMSGQKQVIFVGELFGCKWKVKLDSYIPGKAIVDLKVMRDILHPDDPGTPFQMWVKDTGYMDWIKYWGYDIQAAVYQQIVYQNTGEMLPFFIAAADKHDEPGIGIFYVDPPAIKEALATVESNIPRILDVKHNGAKPDRCELCDHCRATRVLRKEDIIYITKQEQDKKRNQ